MALYYVKLQKQQKKKNEKINTRKTIHLQCPDSQQF